MLFGTDGIRGISTKLLNDNTAYKAGRAAATVTKGARVAVAFDTRLSGRALTEQLIEGIIDGGGRVVECGLMPTPALAYATYKSCADFGVMVSASHNPPEYNGLKFFGGDGNKISVDEERGIEEIIRKGEFASGIGRRRDGTHYLGEYIKRVVDIVDCDLSGTTVTLDCCFGATANTAPKTFAKLGADVVGLCNSYDGRLVNVYSGATNIDYLKNNMTGNIGFSFDGDGDRVLGVTGEGRVVDGDCMLYFLALDLIKRGLLAPKIVVGTKMTNMALSEALKNRGVELLRTDVGDKYVLEEMKNTGAVLGGEQAGHIIVKNEISTGDGILAAALVAKLYKNGVDFSDYKPYPQSLKNYKADKKILKDENFIKNLTDVEKKIEGLGRILVRASGTEPVIRVLVEGKNLDVVSVISGELDYLMLNFGG